MAANGSKATESTVEELEAKKPRCVELNEFISCTICSGYLIDATTIIECLHSFCKTCLINHLKKDNSCPKCNQPVHKTKPFQYIRPDPTLQDIVYKIVPGLFRKEMERRKKLYGTKKIVTVDTDCGKLDIEAVDKSVIDTEMKENEEASKIRTESLSGEERGEYYSSGRTIYSTDDMIPLSMMYMPEVINYSFLPLDKSNKVDLKSVSKNGTEAKHEEIDPKLKILDDQKAPGLPPIEELNKKRYFRCPAGIMIYHLKKLIRNKFDLDPERYSVEMFYRHDQLEDEFTILDLAYIYSWKRNGPLELFYKITDLEKSSLDHGQVSYGQKLRPKEVLDAKKVDVHVTSSVNNGKKRSGSTTSRRTSSTASPLTIDVVDEARGCPKKRKVDTTPKEAPKKKPRIVQDAKLTKERPKVKPAGCTVTIDDAKFKNGNGGTSNVPCPDANVSSDDKKAKNHVVKVKNPELNVSSGQSSSKPEAAVSKTTPRPPRPVAKSSELERILAAPKRARTESPVGKVSDDMTITVSRVQSTERRPSMSISHPASRPSVPITLPNELSIQKIVSNPKPSVLPPTPSMSTNVVQPSPKDPKEGGYFANLAGIMKRFQEPKTGENVEKITKSHPKMSQSGSKLPPKGLQLLSGQTILPGSLALPYVNRPFSNSLSVSSLPSSGSSFLMPSSSSSAPVCVVPPIVPSKLPSTHKLPLSLAPRPQSNQSTHNGSGSSSESEHHIVLNPRPLECSKDPSLVIAMDTKGFRTNIQPKPLDLTGNIFTNFFGQSSNGSKKVDSNVSKSNAQFSVVRDILDQAGKLVARSETNVSKDSKSEEKSSEIAQSPSKVNPEDKS